MKNRINQINQLPVFTTLLIKYTKTMTTVQIFKIRETMFKLTGSSQNICSIALTLLLMGFFISNPHEYHT